MYSRYVDHLDIVIPFAYPKCIVKEKENTVTRKRAAVPVGIHINYLLKFDFSILANTIQNEFILAILQVESYPMPV